MSRILQISNDEILSRTRAMLLGSTGAEVVATTPSKAFTLLGTEKFDLVIVCHTLSREEIKRLGFYDVRPSEGVRALFLAETPFQEPKELVEKTKQLLQNSTD